MQNDTNIIITIPEGVPAPKFELFQKVSYLKQRGVITAMSYTSPLEALAMSLQHYGWTYTISYVFGKTPEAALKAGDADEGIGEDEIQSVVCPCNGGRLNNAE